MDKYEVKIEGENAVVVVPHGPAKGEYRGQFSIGEDGLIKIGTASVNGRSVALKVKPAEMPTLAAWINARKEALRADWDNRAAQREVDAQMVRAGFSTGSAILDRELSR